MYICIIYKVEGVGLPCTARVFSLTAREEAPGVSPVVRVFRPIT